MKKAFSLIELLVSLIIISFIIAAFAPILSTKLKHREIAYSSIQQTKTDCSAFDAPEGSCLLCSKTQCSLCTSSINVPDGYYVNPDINCSRQSCNNFDLNCKRCTKDGCQECKTGYSLTVSKTCSQLTCPAGYKVSGSSCSPCSSEQYQPNNNSTATSCTSCSSLHPNCTSCNSTNGCCSACSGELVVSSCACIPPTCSSTTYWNGSTCAACTTFSPYCTNCTSSGCSTCQEGYHKSGTGCTENDVTCIGSTYRDANTNTCKSCPEHCASCSGAGSCDECEKDYEWVGNICKKKEVCLGVVVPLTISGQSKKYCFMARNFGDDTNSTVNDAFNAAQTSASIMELKSGGSYTQVNSKVTLVTVANGECKSADTNWCCWRHNQTACDATNTDNANSGFSYSGIGRTMCDWRAGYALCNKLKEKTGQDWQLPSRAIMDALATKVSAETASTKTTNIQKYVGSSGLQLCANKGASYGSPSCWHCSNCKKGASSWCRPNNIWSERSSTTASYYSAFSEGKLSAATTWSILENAGIRCVYEMK